MIALTLGVLLSCHAALSYPYPGPAPNAFPGPGPAPRPGPAPLPAPLPAPGPNPGPFYPGGGYGLGGFGGYGGLGGYGGYGGYGVVEEVITPPVSPPVLNTVDVYDIATLGVIPAPPIEYVYPAVGYEAFGLGCEGGYGVGYEGYGLGYEGFGLGYEGFGLGYEGFPYGGFYGGGYY